MTLLKEILHTRARRWGAGALLLGLLLLVAVTCGSPPEETAARKLADLPQPVLDSLSKQAVWCYADYQDGLGRNNSLGYYPTLSLDVALDAPGAQRWMAENAARQYVRCYTSWEAAFHHHDGRVFTRRSANMERVREWLPDKPNEADYEIALLYGVFKDQWQEVRDPAFSPSIKPQRWVLTEAMGNTLNTQ